MSPPQAPQGRSACPVCGGADLSAFYSVAKAPVTCTALFGSHAEARAVRKAEISLVVCGACSLVFNAKFDKALGEFAAEFESSQGASGHFGEFADSLAQEWIERYQLVGKDVLEIGCGGGDFLRRLKTGGVARAIGIDPLADAALANDRRAPIHAIRDVFDERNLGLEASAALCRHTLEHIEDVGGFLRVLRRWAERSPDRVVLFEMPASERIFAERAFWDIYYEHCNYFTKESARYAFETAGFEVIRIERVYDDQYLIVEAFAATTPVEVTAPDALATLRECRAFANDVASSIERCEKRMEQISRDTPPLYLWQGAAKTVGFLAMLNDPTIIAGAFDLSPQRRGKYLPGSGLRVHGPDELKDLKPGHIVLMNPVYLAEVRALVSAQGLAVPVHVINDFLR